MGGRFLEFDKDLKEWRDVGSQAIPHHRAKMGLLGFISFEQIPIKFIRHLERPIVIMSKEEKARTMKALHCSEEKLRTVVNLKDDRFLLNYDNFRKPVNSSIKKEMPRKNEYGVLRTKIVKKNKIHKSRLPLKKKKVSEFVIKNFSQ